MPRTRSNSQAVISFPCRKTRTGIQKKTVDGESNIVDIVKSSPASVSPRKRSNSSNAELQRRVFSPVSPKKKKDNRGKSLDVVAEDTENCSPGGLRLSKNKAQCYSKAKQALHSSIPERLLCRDKEIDKIQNFLEKHLIAKKAGSLYISGAPGTGKTACLRCILNELQVEMKKCQTIFVNCMSVRNSQAIFRKIASELGVGDKVPGKELPRLLQHQFTISDQMKLLVLDEIDQLESKNQEILYTMFEWPSLPRSRLVLIGIANALDLTDRILPRLQARPKCKPKLLHFPPYSKDQIAKILNDRLTKESDEHSVIDTAAVQFCARKVAAVAGDMRKALDICRRAVEIVESDSRKQQILQPVQQGVVKSPMKGSGTPKPKKVGLSHIASVVSEVYGSRLVTASGTEQPTIPLQQKLLICTLLLMLKEQRAKEIVLGKLHETYCRICAKRQVTNVSQEDFIGMCNLLETRGMLGLKKTKESRMAKVCLKIDEKEVDYALQDKILISSILNDGIPRS